MNKGPTQLRITLLPLLGVGPAGCAERLEECNTGNDSSEVSPKASRVEVPHNACCYGRRSSARTVHGVLRCASRLGSCGASSRDRRSSAVASDHLLALPCGGLTLRFITVDPALHVVGDVGEMPSLTAGENAI